MSFNNISNEFQNNLHNELFDSLCNQNEEILKILSSINNKKINTNKNSINSLIEHAKEDDITETKLNKFYCKLASLEIAPQPVPKFDNCPICMEELNPKEGIKALNPCGHLYCTRCCNQLFMTSQVSCPTCRTDSISSIKLFGLIC